MKLLTAKILTPLILLVSFQSMAQHFHYADTAFLKSSVEHKPLMLFFSGSDWCPHCLRFDKTILQDPEFSQYARDHLIILHADFPRRKKLADELTRQNELLSDQYNPQGLFPTLLLFAPDTTLHEYLEYNNQNASTFIELVKEKAASFKTRE